MNIARLEFLVVTTFETMKATQKIKEKKKKGECGDKCKTLKSQKQKIKNKKEEREREREREN